MGTRATIRIVHPIAGVLALPLIATLRLSAAVGELFAPRDVITSITTAILRGFLLPVLAAAGG